MPRNASELLGIPRKSKEFLSVRLVTCFAGEAARQAASLPCLLPCFLASARGRLEAHRATDSAMIL